MEREPCEFAGGVTITRSGLCENDLGDGYNKLLTLRRMVGWY
jgi:hypothetical protein